MDKIYWKQKMLEKGRSFPSQDYLTVLSQIPSSPFCSYPTGQQINAPSSISELENTSTKALTQYPGTLAGSTDMYFLGRY
jgi:hypothetical protein